MADPTCSATTKAGAPCRARPTSGSTPPRCFWHGGAGGARLDEARRRGGAATSRRIARVIAAEVVDAEPAWWRLSTREEIAGALADTVRGLWCGRLDPRSAFALVGAVNALRDTLPDLPPPFVEIVIRRARNPDVPAPADLEQLPAPVAGAEGAPSSPTDPHHGKAPQAL